MEHWNGT